ncbi:hypothetical protein HK101_011478 [Irineochytrium annulatum]|nr:hypothetical protein HK101_011478 [Irineochytrium annulatum]
MDALVAVTLLVLGMAGQDSLEGLTKFAIRFFQGAPLKLLPATILVFNIISLAYLAGFASSYFVDEGTCMTGGFFLNLLSHLFFLSFDFFLLYKCWAVISFHRLFIGAFSLLLVNRLVWAGLDLWRSGPYFADGSCSYSQNVITGFGYSFSDLLVDVLATATVLAFHVKHLFTAGSASKIIRVILEENILRTLVIVAMQSVVIWINGTSTNPFATQLANAVQTYVFVRAINVEFYWLEQRKIVTARQMTKSGSVGTVIEADGDKNSWNDNWLPDGGV